MRLTSAVTVLAAALATASSAEGALPSIFGGSGSGGAKAGAKAAASGRELKNGGKKAVGATGGGKKAGGGGGLTGGQDKKGGPAILRKGKKKALSEYLVPPPDPPEEAVVEPVIDASEANPASEPGQNADGMETILGSDGEAISYDDVLEQTMYDALTDRAAAADAAEDDVVDEEDEVEKMLEKIAFERVAEGEKTSKKRDVYRPKKGPKSLGGAKKGGKADEKKGGGAGGAKKNGKAAKDKLRRDLFEEEMTAENGERSLSAEDLLRHGRKLEVSTHLFGTFSPLTCNTVASNLADCSKTVSSLWVAASSIGTLVIPCGECYTWDLPGDTTLTEGMDVQGKLVFPPDYAATITTTHVVVQGELDISSTKTVSAANRSLKFVLNGATDKSFTPVDSNAGACASFGGTCPIGTKAFVVAGGKLNITALDETTPTWTKLLGLARGQASPLAEGEYDAPPTYPSGPTCYADGALLREDFSSGLPPNFSGVRGGVAEIGPSGEMIVSNRRREWQGPYVDITSLAPCVVHDSTYLLTIKYKLDKDDGSMAGERTQCDTTGQQCLYLQSQFMKDDDSYHELHKWGTRSEQGEKYAEWAVASREVTFDASEGDPTNIFWTLLLRGAEEGTTVSVASIELVPPDAASFSTDGADVCQDLVPGGNGEMHGLNTYPFTKNAGEGHLSKETETQDGSTLSYFQYTERMGDWNSLRSYLNVGCLQFGLTYEISYKLRVHSSLPVDSRVRFFWKKEDDTDSSLDGVVKCQNQQTLDDGWIECKRDFTVDETLSSEPKAGTFYWEIFLEGEQTAEGTTADVDYADLSIVQKGGPVEGLLLPSSVVGTWGAGAEIHITSTTFEGDNSQNAVVDSVEDRNDGTASVKLQSMLGAPTVTEDDQPGYGAEVALLTRNVVIEGYDEGDGAGQGGYVQILHTPGIPQTMEGVELRNMGQLSKKNRFPLQLLYSGSVNGTSLSRNSIVHSNQRCISIDGTSDVLIASNTAHDTAGLCFYTGYESSNNMLQGNLGSVINRKIHWGNRPQGDIDHEGTTFFVIEPHNHLVGNVAAGSPWDGFRFYPQWFTPQEDGSANYNRNIRRLPMGRFEDNIAHSNHKGLHARDLEQVFSGGPSPVFSRLKSYRNRDWGAYVWACLGSSFVGGEVAENRYGLGLHFSEDTKVHDFSITGLSDETSAHLDAVSNSWKVCTSSQGIEGLRFSSAVRNMFAKEHKLSGIGIKNLRVSGFDHPDRCPGSQPIRIWENHLQNLHWNMHAQVDGVALTHDTQVAPIGMVDLCPAVSRGVDDAIIVDLTGDLDPGEASTGLGSIVANSDKMIALALSPCVEHPTACLSYCPGTCYRTLTYRADRDYTASFTLKVTDTATGKSATTAGKIFDYNGDTWQETFDGWDRGRFFSLPLPAGSGPFEAEFLDSEGSQVSPRWAEEWWEPAPSCPDTPGPGDVVLLEPPLSVEDMDAVANGHMDDGVTCYKHGGSGLEAVPVGAGSEGSAALTTPNRHSPYHWIGTYIDIRPLLANSDGLHEISAAIKITSKASGLGVSCNPEGHHWGGCPRVTFRFTYHKDLNAKDGEHFHSYRGDFARTVVDQNVEGLTRLSGIMKPIREIGHFTANGGPHSVLLYIEYGDPDWQYTLDDLSVKALPRPGTCDDNLVHNPSFAEGDSRYWYWHHGGVKLSTAEGTGGAGDVALKATNRGWSQPGGKQIVDISGCYNVGDRIEVIAKYQLLDKNTGEDATWDCNPKQWGGTNGCLDVAIWQRPGGWPGVPDTADRGGQTVRTPQDGAEGGWATVKGFYTVKPGYEDLKESFLYFEAGGNYDTIVDDIYMTRIPNQCGGNLLLNPSVDESSAYWLPMDRWTGVLSLVTPGAGGTGRALKMSDRGTHSWTGLYQKMGLPCLNQLQEGDELTVSAKFRLLEAGTDVGVECDPAYKYPWGNRCPHVYIEAKGCATSDGNLNLRIWNEKDFFQWNSETFNDFETTIIVDANAPLHTCSDYVRVYVKDFDAAHDVVVDDLTIAPPALPTDAPTSSPVQAGPGIEETDMPTASPVTLAPTSTVQSCPGVGEPSIVADNGAVLLARSSDLCLLVKVPTAAGGGTPIPLGRSYLDNDWELSAGTAAEDVAAEHGGWACYVSGCQLFLPEAGDGFEYRLTSYIYALPDRDQVARLLESATFGPRMDEVMALEGAADLDDAMVGWVESQMAEDATSHREYWRRNMNMMYDSTQSVGTTDHPCSSLSRWRKYATTRFDSIWTSVHTLSTASLGTIGENSTETYYSVTIDGHIRTVVKGSEFGNFNGWQSDADGNPYEFQYGTEYEICGADHMHLNVRMNDDNCRSFPAPKVDFPPELVDQVLGGAGAWLDLSGAALEIINDPNIDGTTGNELILTDADGLGAQLCDTLPPRNEIKAAPVFGRLADGSWVQWDFRMRLRDNDASASLTSNDDGIEDGGGSLQLATGGVSLCSNAPRTFLNEETCVLSEAASACNSAPMPEIHIDLNEESITALHNYTKDDEGDGRYVYAIEGLVTKDAFGNQVPHPCTYGHRSRWQLKDTTTAGACSPTSLRSLTNKTLFELLHSSSDSHPYLRDIEVPTTLGDWGALCSPADTDAAYLDVGAFEIDVAGTCWTHVHPDHLSVYDLTNWAEEMNAHPGNMVAAGEGEYNPIKRWRDVDGSSVLIFPANHYEHKHPITRWEANHRTFGYVGRFGDSVRFRDLPSRLRLDGVAAHFSAGTEEVQASSILVCGSPGEVASDPTRGDKFELSVGRDPSWWIREQREWVWTEAALGGGDQLRQRVAWSLAQVLVVVKDAIETQWRKTEAFLVYHDIFVRNAFGNYLDVLREISYSPLMAENLSYLNSRSAAYVYETQKKHSFADENFSREVMQLFTIGLVRLNADGTSQRDPDTGEPLQTYTNEHIMSFARSWTGFGYQQRRGNVEEPDWSGNLIDPMRITADWRDKYPKSDLDSGYIGDGYPLCVDLPPRHHLRKGATYRLIGGSNLPELMEDPVEFATDPTVTKLVLGADSELGTELGKPCEDGSCAYRNEVTLPATIPCPPEGGSVTSSVECKIDTVRSVRISPSEEIYYEYVRPPCVEQTFYSGAVKLSQRHSSWRTICANPLLPSASEACCASGSATAQRNHVYDGERLTKGSAKDRCTEKGLYECDFTEVQYTQGFFAATHFWAKDPCLVRVKVKSDNGYVAVVHEPSDYNEKEYHVDDANRNYFKAYWDGEGGKAYPSPENNCGDGVCQTLSSGGCLCDTSVTTRRVFAAMPRSVEEVVGALKIGALDPVDHDLDGYAVDTATEAVPGLAAYTKNGGAYDEETIFVVEDPRSAGRVHRLKNSAETVRIVPLGGGGSPTPFSFRNAPTFMSLIPSEATVRDARYETEALLEHYFYQESTAPFVAIRLIQRMVSSNPSPRYVAAVSNAFRTGSYTADSSTGGQTFGTGEYGDLASAISAVLLDLEARTPLLDADPSSGSLREPLLKVMGLMRSMEYTQEERYPRLEMWDMQDKIGQMSHEFPSVFSFFLPEHVPADGRVGEAGLVGPEEMLLDMPKTVSLLNGMYGLIKHGLSDCDAGFGNYRHGFAWDGCNVEGRYTRSQGRLTLNHEDATPAAPSSAQVVDDLATLLTAGRLSADSRATVTAAHENAATSSEGLRLAQQLIASSPEFHAAGNVVRKSGAVRPPPTQPQAAGAEYKAIVYLLFAGGADSFNMLTPKECSSKDLYGEYGRVREQVALTLNELLDIDATGQDPPQICETFGLHHHLPVVADMYDSQDLLFFANTGVMTMPVTKDDYYLNTKTPLFAHNHMQRETMRIDPHEERSNTGVLGRMSDALAAQGLSVGSFSVDHNSVSLIGEPGGSPSPFIVSQHGVTAFNPNPSGTNMSQSIADLNAATAPDSGYFAETWSSRLSSSVSDNDNLYNTLQGTTVSADFPDTWLGRKLRTVSRMIATRSNRGVDVDMFFVDIGGWDTHADVKENLNERFTEVNGALDAFRSELVSLDVWDSVTTVQTSDFARTLAPNTGDGTDHAWGGNYMLFGGAVAGGTIKGTYPDDLSDDGPLGLGRGRLIPETPWDAVFHGLAEWVGVEEGGMGGVCPNAGAFPEGTMFTEADLFVAAGGAGRKKQRYLRK